MAVSENAAHTSRTVALSLPITDQGNQLQMIGAIAHSRSVPVATESHARAGGVRAAAEGVRAKAE